MAARCQPTCTRITCAQLWNSSRIPLNFAGNDAGSMHVSRVQCIALSIRDIAGVCWDGSIMDTFRENAVVELELQASSVPW